MGIVHDSDSDYDYDDDYDYDYDAPDAGDGLSGP